MDTNCDSITSPLPYYIIIDCKPIEIKEGYMLKCITSDNSITFQLISDNKEIIHTFTNQNNIVYNGGNAKSANRFREKRKNKSIKIRK